MDTYSFDYYCTECGAKGVKTQKKGLSRPYRVECEECQNFAYTKTRDRQTEINNKTF